MCFITMYLAHAVVAWRIVHCVSTLPRTGKFLILLPLGERLSLCTPDNVGYYARLVLIQMVFPLFIQWISCRLIVGVVSEIVACTHVWYCPAHHSMYVIWCIDQLCAQSLGALRISLGGGLESNNKIYIPPQFHNIPSNITMRCLPLRIPVHSHS